MSKKTILTVIPTGTTATTSNFSTLTVGNSLYSASGVGLTMTTGTAVGTTLQGYVPSTTTYGYSHQVIENPKYDDFWKFKDECDLLWKSYYDTESIFRPVKEKVVGHPCDIQETDDGLRIELTAVGLNEDDLSIIVDSETLRVAYRKTEDEIKKEKSAYRYLNRSIKKASFDIAWKISSKYNLTEMKASLDKGLLILDIPYAKENKPKKIVIGINK